MNFRECITLIPPAVPKSFLPFQITFHFTDSPFTVQPNYTLQAVSHIYIKETKNCGLLTKSKYALAATQNTRPQATIALSFSFQLSLQMLHPSSELMNCKHTFVSPLYVLCGLIFSFSTLFALFQSGQHSFRLQFS